MNESTYSQLASLYSVGKPLDYVVQNIVITIANTPGSTYDNTQIALNTIRPVDMTVYNSLIAFLKLNRPSYLQAPSNGFFSNSSNPISNGVFSNFSNEVSKNRIVQLIQDPDKTISEYADGWINVLRQDPFYLDTSNERPRRTALSQFSRAWDEFIKEKYGQFNKGFDLGFVSIPDSYSIGSEKLATAQGIYMSKYNTNEAQVMGIQRAIEYRDAREDNGLIPQQLVQNVGYDTIIVGGAIILGTVAAAAAPVVLGTSATAATGAATEAGTLAGSTGLLSDASITVSAFDVGGAATSVGAAGSSGAGALAGLGSLLPSGYSAAEIASYATAVSAAASQAKNIGTQLGLIKPNAGDAPIAAPTPIQKQQSNPLPLLVAVGLIFIL